MVSGNGEEVKDGGEDAKRQSSDENQLNKTEAPGDNEAMTPTANNMPTAREAAPAAKKGLKKK